MIATCHRSWQIAHILVISATNWMLKSLCVTSTIEKHDTRDNHLLTSNDESTYSLPMLKY